MLMPTQTNNVSSRSISNTKQPAPARHHHIRTLFASVLGTVALGLILISILAVWLNRTFTNTGAYVGAVAPLVTKPDVQNFIASKVSDQLLSNASVQDLANALLPVNQLSGRTTAELKTELQPIITADVLQVIDSAQFAALWRSVNQTAHQQLIQQLNAKSSSLTLNLHPAIVDVVNQLKTTQLRTVADKLSVDPSAGQLNLTGSGIDKAHTIYTRFQQGTWLIVVATLAAAIGSVALSVHHSKTLRRIMVGSAAIALALAGTIQALAAIKITGSDELQQKAVTAIASTLLHNLQLACLVLAGVCVAIAVGSKLYARLKPKYGSPAAK